MLTALVLLAALAAPPADAPGQAFVHDGVRFVFPAGYAVEEKEEQEPKEPVETIFIGRQGRLELRVEVEKGVLACTEKELAGKPIKGALPDGSPTCEALMPAPPSLDPKIGERHGATVLRQLAGHFLSVVVFAPTAKEAVLLGRQVAATGEVVKEP